MDMEASHFRLMSTSSDTADADDVFETDYQRHVSDVLGSNADAKILCFSEKAPVAKEGRLSFLVFVGCRNEQLGSF